jgi:hypothetical protein
VPDTHILVAKREAKWNPGETAAQQKAHYEVSCGEHNSV